MASGAQSDFNFSSYTEAQFAFEAIGASAWRSLSGLLESRLAAMQLIGAYFECGTGSRDAGVPGCEACCQSILRHYDLVEEDAVYILLETTRRSALLSAISLLDSFLSDALRFLFLYWPHTLPDDVPEKKKPEESYSDYIERVVRRSRRFSSQSKRVDFLASSFDVSLDAELRAELSRLTDLRNEITHHSGFYRFVVDARGGLRSEEKPLPYVTEEDASKVSVIVGDVSDAIYVSMSLRIFGVAPQVRPVNTDLAAIHKAEREKWAINGDKEPVIEEFVHPRWSVKVSSNPGRPWVGDKYDAWIIIPPGADSLPPSISFRWNNRYGMKAWASVDNNPREEIKTFTGSLLDQMLAGQSVVVEYHEQKSDGPKRARFSLDGFAEAWHAACRRKEKSKNA